MDKDFVFPTILIFIALILFEVSLYISIKEKFESMEYAVKSINIEIEELRKTQRLISQDAEMSLRLAVESAGGTDEK